MMDRPKCRRCGGPLDLWCEEGEWEFACNNPMFTRPDASFWAEWEQLPGDDVVRLLKQIEGAA